MTSKQSIRIGTYVYIQRQKYIDNPKNKKKEIFPLHVFCALPMRPPIPWKENDDLDPLEYNEKENPDSEVLYYILFHAWFHPSRGGLSVCNLAYSIGNKSVNTPFLFIEIRKSLEPRSPHPVRSSSQAADMACCCRWSSISCSLRNLFWYNCHARWIVQWRRYLFREKRRGRGVSGWYKKYLIRAMQFQD